MALRKPNFLDEIKVGLFSKKEAGLYIGKGLSHLHSSVLGVRDPLAMQTMIQLQDANYFVFPWQEDKDSQQTSLESSRDRHGAMERILFDLEVKNRREVSERLRVVLEELFSNAIYHSFKTEQGLDKYDRCTKVNLIDNERVIARYARKDAGIYLSVEDSGGQLTLPSIVSVFQRCYSGEPHVQIDSKDQGAGLGLYMIFETVTHLRIDVLASKKTKISIWLPEKRHPDPDYFSFNFFQWEKPWE